MIYIYIVLYIESETLSGPMFFSVFHSMFFHIFCVFFCHLLHTFSVIFIKFIGFVSWYYLGIQLDS